MADLSDSELFDSVASGNPAPELQPEPTPAPQLDQHRDESGRFSQKPSEPARAETLVEPVQQPQETPADNKGGVPVGAVQAEREKRQAAQQEAEALRRELAELRGMVMAQRQPTPQTPQQEQKPASIFEDPDAYLQSQLNPVQQTVQELREELWESRAAVVHTQATVDAAKAAAEALDPVSKQNLHRQLMAGGNPFDILVKWHKQQETLSKVGGDPDAWLNAEIEKRLSDPTFLAQAVERARAGATPAPGNRQQQPVTSIPPSLARLPAGGNAPPQGDTSDAAMFESVTSRRR